MSADDECASIRCIPVTAQQAYMMPQVDQQASNLITFSTHHKAGYSVPKVGENILIQLSELQGLTQNLIRTQELLVDYITSEGLDVKTVIALNSAVNLVALDLSTMVTVYLSTLPSRNSPIPKPSSPLHPLLVRAETDIS